MHWLFADTDLYYKTINLTLRFLVEIQCASLEYIKILWNRRDECAPSYVINSFYYSCYSNIFRPTSDISSWCHCRREVICIIIKGLDERYHQACFQTVYFYLIVAYMYLNGLFRCTDMIHSRWLEMVASQLSQNWLKREGTYGKLMWGSWGMQHVINNGW